MILGIEHTGVSAQDPTALVRWYEKHLGMKIIRQIGDSIYFIMAENGAILEVYPAAQTAQAYPNNASGIRHLAILVKDIEAEQKKMLENGVDIDRDVPAPGETRLIFLRDCEGNILHLVERAAPLG